MKLNSSMLFFSWGGGHAKWFAGSQFPNQGSNPGHGSENLEYQSLGHQGTPYAIIFNEI